MERNDKHKLAPEHLHVLWEKETQELLNSCQIELFQSWVTASVQTNPKVNKALKDTIVYYGIDNKNLFIVTKEQKHISSKGLNNFTEPDLKVRVEQQAGNARIELVEESKRRLREIEQGKAQKEDHIGYYDKQRTYIKVPTRVDGQTLILQGNIHYDPQARGEQEKLIVFNVYQRGAEKMSPIGNLTIEYSGEKRSDMIPLIAYEFNKPAHYQHHAAEALITASGYLINDREFSHVKLAVDKDKDPLDIPQKHLKLSPEKHGEPIYRLDKNRQQDLTRALHPSQGFNHKQYELVLKLGKLEQENQHLTQQLKNREYQR